MIVSTINKYMYVCLNKKYNSEIRAAYTLTENVKNTYKLNHDIIREALKYMVFLMVSKLLLWQTFLLQVAVLHLQVLCQ